MVETPYDKLCFAMMWFDDERRPVYDYAIKPAAEHCGFECRRTDDLPGTFAITHQIIDHIFDADISIADLTGGRPNVFYEAGIGHVMGHKTILLCDKTRMSDIPFDLRDYHVLLYEMKRKGLQALREQLEHTLKSVAFWQTQPAGNPVQRARPCRVLPIAYLEQLLTKEKLLADVLIESERLKAELARCRSEIRSLKDSQNALKSLYVELIDRLNKQSVARP